MRGMPFELQQGKGGLDVVVQGAVEAAAAFKEREAEEVFWSSLSVGINKRKRGLVKEGLLEPRSVLDQRRSPSPPTSTSTSTLSSSLGGGAASSDTVGVAAISDTTATNNHNNTPAHKWPPSDDSTPSSAHPQASAVADERKDEWAAELPPIPAGLEMGLVGGEKCGGLGVEDWEAMLGESDASPGQEQTFFGWIMNDMEDPNGLKQQQAQQQHLLLSQVPASDFDTGSAGLGFALVDPGGFGFEPSSGSTCAAPPPGSASTVNRHPSSNLSSSSGFPSIAGNNRNTSRGVSSVQQSQSVGATTFPSMKVPSFGNSQAGSSPVVFPPAPANSLLSLPPELFFNEPMEEKPQLFGPGGLLLNQPQQQSHHSPNPTFFLPLPSYSAAQPEHGLLPPQQKRHHTDPSGQISPKIPFSNSAAVGGAQDMFLRPNQAQAPPQLQSVPYHLQHRPMKPKAAGDEAAAVAALQQQQMLVDQLVKAAELVETGMFNGARGILARLNQQLPSPIGKPLLRSVFYFKEALHHLLNPSHSPSTQRTIPLATPLDVVLKLSAYKAFSDLSPIVQFANFTCIQALLEELGNSDRIHIVDFDIGVGGQWSSFMQELAQRRCTTTANPAPIYLKITAFVSPCSHHPLELHLTRENLAHFAADLNIPFEFNTLPLDSFDPPALLAMSAGADEAIAVNLPVGSMLSSPVPALLRLVKQLSPRIVVCVDQGADRSDLPFSQHVIRALESSMVLLDSIDAAGALPDVTDKIERYLLQPRIEGVILGRDRAGEKVLSLRTLFTSLGFTPVQFSNFTETQAECIIKRVQVRGFHVEKRQASLILYWQRGELTSVSAWHC